MQIDRSMVNQEKCLQSCIFSFCLFGFVFLLFILCSYFRDLSEIMQLEGISGSTNMEYSCNSNEFYMTNKISFEFYVVLVDS